MRVPSTISLSATRHGADDHGQTRTVPCAMQCARSMPASVIAALARAPVENHQIDRVILISKLLLRAEKSAKSDQDTAPQPPDGGRRVPPGLICDEEA